MANWFIAIVVDPTGWYPERVPPPPEGLTAFDPSDLHMTIAFLGNVAEPLARRAWAALSWPLGPFDVELGEVVPMGSPRRYSALSCLLGEGRGQVEEAIEGARGALLAAAEVPLDARPAKAHVTLARPSRTASNEARRRGLEWAKTVPTAGTRLSLRELALYTWSADRRRSLFQKVAVTSSIPTGLEGGA